MFPTTINDPADWFIPKLFALPDVKQPVTFPITTVFPAVDINPAVAVGANVAPVMFPLTIIVPADDLLIAHVLFPDPPLKLLPVIIKSQLPVWFITWVVALLNPVTVALGALIFTVPVVAVTVIKLVALALIPAATLADMLPLLKLNDPPDKFPAPEPVDSVSSISATSTWFPAVATAVTFNL